MAGLRVKQDQIAIKDNAVLIRSPQLIEELIHNSEEVLQLMSSSGSSVSLGDISIDAEGRVVIDNPAFREAIKMSFTNLTLVMAADANGICGLRC